MQPLDLLPHFLLIVPDVGLQKCKVCLHMAPRCAEYKDWPTPPEQRSIDGLATLSPRFARACVAWQHEILRSCSRKSHGRTCAHGFTLEVCLIYYLLKKPTTREPFKTIFGAMFASSFLRVHRLPFRIPPLYKKHTTLGIYMQRRLCAETFRALSTAPTRNPEP